MGSTMISYFSRLSPAKIILWCYLIWYGATLCFYFDPTLSIWLNSLGISFVIGIALMLSVSRNGQSKPDYWQTVRLFLMPFCVSSFSALIKGEGFVLILSPRPVEQAVTIGACLLFVCWVLLLKWSRKHPAGG